MNDEQFSDEELSVFAAEAEEHLNSAEDILLGLEKNGASQVEIEQLLRAMHTLKGNAASIGYEDMAKLAHSAEDVVIAVRDEQMSVDADVMDTLLSAVDMMRHLTHYDDDDNSGVDELLESLNHSLQNIDTKSGNGQSSEYDKALSNIETMAEEGSDILQVSVELTEDTDMPSVRALQVLMFCEDWGDVIDSIPGQQEIEETGQVNGQIKCFLCAESDIGELRQGLKNLPNVACVDCEQMTAEKSDDEDTETESISATKDRPSSVEETPDGSNSTHIRVAVSTLDDLMNLAGEMVINRNRLNNLVDELALQDFTDGVEDLRQTVDMLSRVTAEVQGNIMQMRLVPMDRLFRRFPRLMRDLQRSQEKKFNFKIEGGQTEIDRSLLKVISDPLTHLLRNAVDHGIETPQIRESLGKDPEGTIVLSAVSNDNHITINVSDDGSGIDLDAVSRRAIDRGLITTEQAEQMQEQELIELMFNSGFSTSENVTEISGRGVGLDVVRREVDSSGGEISVENRPGAGTTFSLSFPLAVTSVKSLLVRIGQQIYVIPLGSVRETLHLNTQHVHSTGDSSTLHLRDELIPLFQLSDFFPSICELRKTEQKYIVVLEADQKHVGFVVDDLIGEEECVIKPLSKPLDDISGISSATILPDGGVALILDAGGLLMQLTGEERRFADGQDTGS